MTRSFHQKGRWGGRSVVEPTSSLLTTSIADQRHSGTIGLETINHDNILMAVALHWFTQKPRRDVTLSLSNFGSEIAFGNRLHQTRGPVRRGWHCCQYCSVRTLPRSGELGSHSASRGNVARIRHRHRVDLSWQCPLVIRARQDTCPHRTALRRSLLHRIHRAGGRTPSFSSHVFSATPDCTINGHGMRCRLNFSTVEHLGFRREPTTTPQRMSRPAPHPKAVNATSTTLDTSSFTP